ncbi:MAG: hypothetical protein R6U70_11010 [Bacillota bacterium]
MSERFAETAKSMILALLVLSSILLSLALWFYGPPISSLPPALTDGAGPDLSESIPAHLFEPVSLTYHDGRGVHCLASPDERATAVEMLQLILSSLLPGDIERVRDDGELDEILVRRQVDRPGVTVWLPGPVPMDLWMRALGAPEGFPRVMMDRLFFYLDRDDMMHLYIPTERGWYHTEWTVLEGIADEMDPEDLFSPAQDLESAGYEAEAISLWATWMGRQAEAMTGEPAILLLGWRDMTLSALLSIPEMDVEVTTFMAEPVLVDASDHVASLFSDLAAVRERAEPDHSTTYTDGYRSLRVTADGTLAYTLVTPSERESGQLGLEPGIMLNEAWAFLRDMLGDSADELRLMRVEPTRLPSGGSGQAEVDGYEFEFSQVFANTHLVAAEGLVRVRVDEYGVRRAVLTLLSPVDQVQRTLAITPISAVQRCQPLIGEDVAFSVQRIHLVSYPSEESDDQQVVRPAWLVDFGPGGRYLVDAVSGDVTQK